MKKWLLAIVVLLGLMFASAPIVSAADYTGAIPTINNYIDSIITRSSDDASFFHVIESDGDGQWADIYKISPNHSLSKFMHLSFANSDLVAKSDGTVVICAENKLYFIAPNDAVTSIDSARYTCLTPNGAGLMCIRNGTLTPLSSDNKFGASVNWTFGSTRNITAAATRPDGKIVLGGQDGRWAVYNGTTLVTSGTVADAGQFTRIIPRSDGTTVMTSTSNKIFVMSALNTVTHVGTSGSYINEATKLTDDNIILSSANSSQVFKPDNTFGNTINQGGYVTSLSDNTLIYVANRTFTHCYFTIDSPPTYSNITQNSLRINWPESSTPGIGFVYRVEKSLDGNNFTEIGTTTNNYYNDTNLSPGTRYYYRVRVSIPTNYPYSSVSSTRTIPATPNAPAGTGEGLTWSATAGRGKVVLNWTAVAGATGYKVYVFDGNQYRGIDAGNTTSWDSSAAKIYPDENWLNSHADNSISDDPFNHVAGGFDLRDDPVKLYLKTIGTTYDTAHNYWFKVSAYNESGESPQSASAYITTLPNRTDTSPPSCTATAKSTDGLDKTHSTTVNVTVNSADTESGVYQIQLSNDNVSFTTVHTATKNADNSTGVLNYNNTFSWTITNGAGTKTIYVKTLDSTGNSSTATCSIALSDDTIPPVITMQINNGAVFTTASTVTLTLNGYDNASTVDQLKMCISNNGTIWTEWQAFVSPKTWDITDPLYGGTPTPGTKTVYAKVADLAQNTTMIKGEISYNTTRPTGTVSVSGGTEGTLDGKSVIFVSGDIPTISVTATNALHIRYDTGNGTWSDWEDYISTLDLVLSKSNGTCRVRVQIKDSYGVPSEETVLHIVADSEVPVIESIQGLNGATCTSSGTFNVLVSANDNQPGQLQARAKVDEGVYGDWINIPGSSLSVPLPQGAHTITVQVKDAAGNTATKTMTAFGL